MKSFCITSLLLLTITFSLAQNSSLKGRIIDSNGFPLPGATLEAKPSGKFAVTDFNGFFTNSRNRR